MAAGGESNVTIARRYGVTPQTVAIWRTKFAREGLNSVRRAGHGFAPPAIVPPRAVQVLTRLAEVRCVSSAADELARLQEDVRSLQDDLPDLWPPFARAFGLSGSESALPVAGIYLSSSQRAVVLRRRHSRDVPKGGGPCRSHNDYLFFLRELDWHVPEDEPLHVILDRISPQVSHHKVDRWLTNPKRARFKTYVIPSPLLWMSLVKNLLRPIYDESITTLIDVDQVATGASAGRWILADRPTDKARTASTAIAYEEAQR